MAWLAAAAATTLAGNVAFHVFVARGAGVSGYSVVGTLLSFGSVAAIFGAGIQYAIARRTAQNESKTSVELLAGARSLVPWLALLTVGLVLAAPLSSYLHLDAVLPTVNAFGYFAATLVVAVPTGVLVGQERFAAFAVLTILGVAVRLGLTVALWGTDVTADQAISASSIATIVIALLAAATVMLTQHPTSPPRAPPDSETSPRRLPAEAASGALLGTAIWLVWMLPLFFSRHYLPGPEAGAFSAAQLSTTTILFLTAAVTTSFFPFIATAGGRRVVLSGLATTVATCLLGVAGLCSLGPWVIPRLYGDQYQVSSILFLRLGVSVTISALASYWLWSTRARRGSSAGAASAVAIALVAEILIGVAWHSGQEALALGPGLAILTGAALSLSLHLTLRARRLATRSCCRVAAAIEDSRPDRAALALGQLAVGIFAYNEASTIRACVEAILYERAGGVQIPRVVIVVSASTDGTDSIAADIAAENPRVTVITEAARRGKAAAINRFLEATTEPLCAIVSADTLPARGALTAMAESLTQPGVGMSGCRVVPQNDESGVANRLVHLLWTLHHEVALVDPKLGEVVAFRRLFERIDPIALADEVCIEAEVRSHGLTLQYLPDATIYNRGPEKVREYVRHRMRNHRAHVVVRASSGYKASTLPLAPVMKACARYGARHPQACLLLGAAAVLEGWARLRARTSPTLRAELKRGVWEPLGSAKQPITPSLGVFGPLDHEVSA